LEWCVEPVNQLKKKIYSIIFIEFLMNNKLDENDNLSLPVLGWNALMLLLIFKGEFLFTSILFILIIIAFIGLYSKKKWGAILSLPIFLVHMILFGYIFVYTLLNNFNSLFNFITLLTLFGTFALFFGNIHGFIKSCVYLNRSKSLKYLDKIFS